MSQTFKCIPLLFGLALTAISSVSLAQAEKPIHMIVGFPAGGPLDNVARPFAQQLSKELNRTVLIEYKAGANGNIAATFVSRAPADGSVLFFSSVGAIAISGALYRNLPYDPMKDLAPVSLLVNNSSILMVSIGNPARDMKEFIRNAALSPRPAPVSSSGIGSIPHMALALFEEKTNANVIHVPYKGAAPAVVDIMGGHVDALFADAPAVMSQVKAKKLKALGVAGPSRLPLFPDTPTLAEQGITGVESNNWYALLAPGGTPIPVVDAISAAARRSLAAPSVRESLVGLGTVPVGSTPEELATVIKADTAKWSAIVKAHNIVGE